MWDKINVWQYQNLVKSITSKKEGGELITTQIAIVHNMTENEVDSLPLEKYKELEATLDFLHGEMPVCKPQKWIQVRGKRYRLVYDVRRMPFARYIESKHFAEDLVNNLHKIGATMVYPQKKGIFGWKDDKYDASKHSEYADDLLEAPILALYGSLVFFYQVYRNWMQVSMDYMIEQAMKKHNLTKEEGSEMIQSFLNILDGSIPLSRLQNTKDVKLPKPMNSARLNV